MLLVIKVQECLENLSPQTASNADNMTTKGLEEQEKNWSERRHGLTLSTHKNAKGHKYCLSSSMSTSAGIILQEWPRTSVLVVLLGERTP